MNLRVILCWLLAIPMFLLLALFTFCFLGALVLLAFHGADSQRIFFVTGSFLYLFCAHLLFFGSYFALPPFYQGRLGFFQVFFRTPKYLLPLSVVYIVCFGHMLHYFKII